MSNDASLTSTHDAADRTWLSQIPKVELHVHIEGAIPHHALWELIQKYGGDLDCPDRASLRSKFVYRDFPHFIDTWLWKNGFLREYEDFTFIAEAVAREFAAGCLFASTPTIPKCFTTR